MVGNQKIGKGNTDAGAKAGPPSFGLGWGAMTTPPVHSRPLSFCSPIVYISPTTDGAY